MSGRNKTKGICDANHADVQCQTGRLSTTMLTCEIGMQAVAQFRMSIYWENTSSSLLMGNQFLLFKSPCYRCVCAEH
ncbi:hypothetical protein J6590_039802 [Homalodisca vitripennis]|nr:hypothetical protein J6590_039802 [Homalodisca vitripennis]